MQSQRKDVTSDCHPTIPVMTTRSGTFDRRFLAGLRSPDPKLLDAVKVDTKKNKVKVDLSRLYKGIDLPETLSNLTGKRIRRILPAPPSAQWPAGEPGAVEFEDGTIIDLTKQDFEFFKLIKPLIWW